MACSRSPKKEKGGECLITVKILDPEKGDRVETLQIPAAADLILQKQQEEDYPFGFVKWSDGQILELMDRTGIIEQLEQRDGEQITIVPNIGGG